MRVQQTDLDGVLLIEPRVHRDDRGFFLESYHHQRYAEAGIDVRFVQDNHSVSRRGVLRGLHAQRSKPQAKLVRAVEGEVFDVGVDIRPASPSFGRWFGANLSSSNFLQMFLPPGFAHGFCVLSERAQVEYKCTDFYDPSDEISIAWDDPDIGIDWPIQQPELSDKDRSAHSLAELFAL